MLRYTENHRKEQRYTDISVESKYFDLDQVYLEERTVKFHTHYHTAKEKGLFKSNAELAKVLGYSGGSAITEILGGRMNISPEKYLLFLKYYDIKDTEKSVDSPKENHIKKRHELKANGERNSGIEVFESAPVQAGYRNVYHDEHQVPDYVLQIPQFKNCNYGTRASGDSMYPEIRNGDLVVCQELPPGARIIYGDMYIIHTRDGIETIKYVQQFTDGTDGEPWLLLVPHNKNAGMGTPIPRSEITKIFKVRAVFKAY